MIRLEGVALRLLLSILYIPLLLFTAAATSGNLFIFLVAVAQAGAAAGCTYSRA